MKWIRSVSGHLSRVVRSKMLVVVYLQTFSHREEAPEPSLYIHDTPDHMTLYNLYYVTSLTNEMPILSSRLKASMTPPLLGCHWP
ncbi:hypothetical protein CRENBAI_013645 [Crenichthys baileyi]|uniref:Uncharacterized protein n=1 Tax=Crenichthys baileyi TaxID=28760 RepID=A0AAV9RM23_9TELE